MSSRRRASLNFDLEKQTNYRYPSSVTAPMGSRRKEETTRRPPFPFPRKQSLPIRIYLPHQVRNERVQGTLAPALLDPHLPRRHRPPRLVHPPDAYAVASPREVRPVPSPPPLEPRSHHPGRRARCLVDGTVPAPPQADVPRRRPPFAAVAPGERRVHPPRHGGGAPLVLLAEEEEDVGLEAPERRVEVRRRPRRAVGGGGGEEYGREGRVSPVPLGALTYPRRQRPTRLHSVVVRMAGGVERVRVAPVVRRPVDVRAVEVLIYDVRIAYQVEPRPADDPREGRGGETSVPSGEVQTPDGRGVDERQGLDEVGTARREHGREVAPELFPRRCALPPRPSRTTSATKSSTCSTHVSAEYPSPSSAGDSPSSQPGGHDRPCPR
ncbi:hypothetical protein THAOC_20147 [Thalassiosira oceanica]|uniref:Uncharacterized protein n=1 Tax=Thalassiosira oceanica TaxID=159749 RepID=K0SMC9_THAOC|nr:hypothetical protein THAOC_20147 [Thalassiosira oceanica]|eukprot:EJK59602.1 hypothetical protein THAOC_20147 [Thalassiosira oceanica]